MERLSFVPIRPKLLPLKQNLISSEKPESWSISKENTTGNPERKIETTITIPPPPPPPPQPPPPPPPPPPPLIPTGIGMSVPTGVGMSVPTGVGLSGVSGERQENLNQLSKFFEQNLGYGENLNLPKSSFVELWSTNDAVKECRRQFNEQVFKLNIQWSRTKINATIRNTEQKRPKEFYVKTQGNKKMLYQYKDGSALHILPPEEYYDVIFQNHLETDHGGERELFNRLKSFYYMPKKLFKIFNKYCYECRLKKAEQKTMFINRGIVEIIDMQQMPDGEYNWILHYQDESSAFSFLRALKSDYVLEIAEELLKIFLEVGFPAALLSNDHIFIKNVIQKLENLCPLCKIFSGVGTVPLANKHSREMIVKTLEFWMNSTKSKNWSLGIYFVEFKKNSCSYKSEPCIFNKTQSPLPFRIFFKRDPIMGAILTKNRNETTTYDNDTSDSQASSQEEDAMDSNKTDYQKCFENTIQHDVFDVETAITPNIVLNSKDNADNFQQYSTKGSKKHSNTPVSQINTLHLNSTTQLNFSAQARILKNNILHLNSIRNSTLVKKIPSDFKFDQVTYPELVKKIITDNAKQNSIKGNKIHLTSISQTHTLTSTTTAQTPVSKNNTFHINSTNNSTTSAHLLNEIPSNVTLHQDSFTELTNPAPVENFVKSEDEEELEFKITPFLEDDVTNSHSNNLLPLSAVQINLNNELAQEILKNQNTTRNEIFSQETNFIIVDQAMEKDVSNEGISEIVYSQKISLPLPTEIEHESTTESQKANKLEFGIYPYTIKIMKSPEYKQENSSLSLTSQLNLHTEHILEIDQDIIKEEVIEDEINSENENDSNVEDEFKCETQIVKPAADGKRHQMTINAQQETNEFNNTVSGLQPILYSLLHPKRKRIES